MRWSKRRRSAIDARERVPFVRFVLFRRNKSPLTRHLYKYASYVTDATAVPLRYPKRIVPFCSFVRSLHDCDRVPPRKVRKCPVCIMLFNWRCVRSLRRAFPARVLRCIYVSFMIRIKSRDRARCPRIIHICVRVWIRAVYLESAVSSVSKQYAF